jgi:Helicase HerA, central domain
MVVDGHWQGYEFRPVSATIAPEQVRTFVVRLRRALRAAHGLGLEIRMRWNSGPGGRVSLGVSSPSGVRWVQFGLSSPYELGQWRTAEDWVRLSEARPQFNIFSAGPAELPFPSPLDEVPWSETVLGQLRACRTGLTVAWELVPDRGFPARESWFPDWTDPPVKDNRVRTLPERGLNDRQEARKMGLRWRVRGRILSDAHEQIRAAGPQVAHVLEAASHLEGGNRFVCQPSSTRWTGLRQDPVLTEAELVGLFPPPAADVLVTARISDSDGPRLWLGSDLKGVSVGLPVHPEQGRHLLVLGETGMGKSSLIVRMAWQAARWGSVLLFDPVGDTAQQFLSGVPETRASDVSWVSPAAPSLTLNLLQEVASQGGGSQVRRERLLGDVVAALRRVRAGRYPESSFWGPRLEEMLFLALRAASEWPGASLRAAERLLMPEGFPLRTVPEGARESVEEVRRRIMHAPQDGEGARRLLAEIVRSGVLSTMLDANLPTWSIGASVAPGRITVVSGDAPQVGESAARYVLAVVLALTWNEMLTRRGASKTFLVLDEAQWYAHDSVAEMLRLGRRFNLHVWAITQSLRSLPENLRDAFATNSADVILFRGDPLDVRDISRWAPQVAPERLMRLPRGEAAVLIDKGAETHWVRLSAPARGRGDPLRFRPRSLACDPPEATPPLGPALEDAGSPGRVTERNNGARPAPPFMEALTVLAAQPGGGSELTVRLEELRASWSADPLRAERSVRDGGRFLASKGALLRSGRDDAGSFWILSRARLTELLAPERRNSEPGANGGAQVSLAAERVQGDAI